MHGETHDENAVQVVPQFPARVAVRAAIDLNAYEVCALSVSAHERRRRWIMIEARAIGRGEARAGIELGTSNHGRERTYRCRSPRMSAYRLIRLYRMTTEKSTHDQDGARSRCGTSTRARSSEWPITSAVPLRCQQGGSASSDAVELPVQCAKSKRSTLMHEARQGAFVADGSRAGQASRLEESHRHIEGRRSSDRICLGAFEHSSHGRSQVQANFSGAALRQSVLDEGPRSRSTEPEKSLLANRFKKTGGRNNLRTHDPAVTARRRSQASCTA